MRRPKLLGRRLTATFVLLLLLWTPSRLLCETIYAVVLGHTGYIVGSSTLHSGLYRSIDGARSWEQLGPRNLKAYSMDAVDSSMGRILYIAAGNGIHKSTDSGRTWKITTDWRITEVLDVKVNQRNPRWVYAATAWGFWRSSDGGETWENPESPLRSTYLYRLAITPDNTLLAWRQSGYSASPFTSGAHGASWRAPSSPDSLRVQLPCRYQQQGDRGETSLQRAFSMNVYDGACGDSGIVYLAGDRGVLMLNPIATTGTDRSLGDGWSNISGNLPASAVHAVAYSRRNGLLLAGTFGDGLYRREGSLWSQSGLQGSQIWSLIVKDY